MPKKFVKTYEDLTPKNQSLSERIGFRLPSSEETFLVTIPVVVLVDFEVDAMTESGAKEEIIQKVKLNPIHLNKETVDEIIQRPVDIVVTQTEVHPYINTDQIAVEAKHKGKSAS